MSTMAMSALNPDAPMFIPAAFKKVEDYSPEWWELVKTTAWFRDHWFRQHQLYEDLADDVDDVAALLPDDSVDLLDADDLFYSPPSPQPQPDFHHYNYKPAGLGGDMDAVLKTLSVSSPRGGGPAPAWAPVRHAEKPAQHVGGPRAGGGARRAIHQPR
uniref:Predicted protein n=1 Tax=Hordeum vulgare subsp. vulgare TaxID=112509 RepID=F2DK53_HORVV|nr:predicted protein [Hordeum vulgare subsp. vulgare]